MILITRPEKEALYTASLLQAKGYETLVDPQLEIFPVEMDDVPLPLQAALFTSTNGVECVSEGIIQVVPKTLVVGEATAEVARARGFHQVISAPGTVDHLLDLCLQELDPKAGPVIHFCGHVTRGDLVGRLVQEGFVAYERIVYNAVAKECLESATVLALQRNEITSALFFSPRTAKVYMQNLKRHGLERSVKTQKAYCISLAVADQIKDAGWDKVFIASQPDHKALLALIDSEGIGEHGQDRQNHG